MKYILPTFLKWKTSTDIKTTEIPYTEAVIKFATEKHDLKLNGV